MIMQKLNRFLTLIGWPGGIGLALLGGALVMSFALERPLRGENVLLANEIVTIEPQTQKTSPAASADELRKQLEAFIATLPEHDEINDQLNPLHELAALHHLSIKSSEYRSAQNGNTDAIRQLRINIKTEGEYTDLRNLLREIQRELPALSIEQLTLTRQKIADTKLDITVEFILFYSSAEISHS
jgi:hypothetical protein